MEGHQAHRALGEDRHRATDGDLGVLRRDETRGEHVGAVMSPDFIPALFELLDLLPHAFLTC